MLLVTCQKTHQLDVLLPVSPSPRKPNETPLELSRVATHSGGAGAGWSSLTPHRRGMVRSRSVSGRVRLLTFGFVDQHIF